MNESAAILEAEGDYPHDIVSATSYDNFTAAIMLEQCVTKEGNPFIESLRNSYYFTEGSYVSGIKEVIGGEVNANYPRYWHGYVVALKPLLVFFNVQEIRIIFQTILLVMFGIAAVCISRSVRSGGLSLGILLLLSGGLFTSMKAAADLPLFFSFFVMLIGVALVSLIPAKKLLKIGPYWFFILGALTVFFDFLDTPIITLGVPLCVYLVRLQMEGNSNYKLIKTIVFAAFLWFVGYGYLWCLKWIIAALVLGSDVIASALNAATFRLGVSESSADYGTSPIGAIHNSIDRLGFVKYFLVLAGVLVILLFIPLVTKSWRENRKFISNNIVFPLTAVAIAALPYLWFIALSNHTFIHAFTYRDQIVALFALCVAVWYMSQGLFLKHSSKNTVE